MKGGSSLNPYAEAYVPLSKRQTTDSKNELTPRGPPPQIWEPPRVPPQARESYKRYGADIASHLAENSKIYESHGYHGSSSYNPAAMSEGAMSDDDFEMHLAYLQLTFPSVKYDFLAEVFVANNYDVDATVDILNNLEVYASDYSPKLPETLDIGDVPDTGVSSEVAPVGVISSNLNIGGGSGGGGIGGSSADVPNPTAANLNLDKSN